MLNKIFFSRVERTQKARQRRWRIRAWVVYLVGLPAWLAVFGLNSNWIAFGVEFGGSLSMALGLVNAIRGKEKEPTWLKYAALIGAVIGFGLSLNEFGGITIINQWLELGLAGGFLFGTYFLARENPIGYIFLLIMLGSNAYLMWIQSYPWLSAQQIISVLFIADAYQINYRNETA